MQVIFSEAMFF